MAIAKGTESKEAQEFKRYIGVAPVFIKAVNPTKKEHEQLFNTTLEESPNYLGDVKDENDNVICKSARIQVVLKIASYKGSDPLKIKADFEDSTQPIVTMSLFLQNRPRVGATSGKTQVIDKYGRTAWATPTELAAHTIPVYANGPADIDKDYRPAYVGEEELMAFVKAYLWIPDVTVFDTNLRKMVPNTKVKPEECECRFDNLNNIFKGDFSEIQDALGFQPLNKVKVLLGVRTDAKTNKLFQSVYTRKFLKNSATKSSYNSLDKEIQENIRSAMERGRSVDTEYEVTDVHEYSVEPTTFTPNTAEPSSDMPFDTETSALPWE